MLTTHQVERAHLVRAATHRRSRDGFWWAGMLIIFSGFGTISTFAFASPAYVKPSSSGCMMGLPPSLLIPLLIYDIVINTLLTLHFVYFLLQTLRFRGGIRYNKCLICRAMQKLIRIEEDPRMEVLERRPLQSASTGSFTNQLESLIKRSLAAALLLMFPTILNLSIMLKYNGFEEGWACFISCSFDVTWSVAIIHWLTTAETSASPPQRPGLSRSSTSGLTLPTKTETTRIPASWTQRPNRYRSTTNGTILYAVTETTKSATSRPQYLEMPCSTTSESTLTVGTEITKTSVASSSTAL